MAEFEKQEYQEKEGHYYVNNHGLLFIVCKVVYYPAFVPFWSAEVDSQWHDEEKAHTHAKILNDAK